MAFDENDLTQAPDIENFDPSKGDRGDALPEPEKKIEPVVEDDHDDDNAEDDDTKGDTPETKDEKDDEPDDQPRDDKGRFKEKEARIPKSRFDEAVGKEREAKEAAERRAAELEQQLKSREQANKEHVGKEQRAKLEEMEAGISKLERQHAQLLLEGDVDKAAEVMRQIRMSERQMARAEASAEAAQQTAIILERERVDAVIARLQADYAVLNESSAEYDPDMVEFILSKQQALIQREGMSHSKALTKAAEQVMSRFAKQETKEEPKKGLEKAQEDRRQKQIEKNLDTAKRQPASMKESGADSDKYGQNGLPDVSKMTQEEFAALPASTLAKLRGDLV